MRNFLRKSVSIVMGLLTLSTITYAGGDNSKVAKKRAKIKVVSVEESINSAETNMRRLLLEDHNISTLSGLQERYFNVSSYSELDSGYAYDIIKEVRANGTLSYKFNRIKTSKVARKKTLSFDFHYLSCEAVRYILKDIENCLDDMIDENSFEFINFITGIGCHTEEEKIDENGNTPLKRVIMNYCESKNVTIERVKGNNGILRLNLRHLRKQLRKLKAAQQPSFKTF